MNEPFIPLVPPSAPNTGAAGAPFLLKVAPPAANPGGLVSPAGASAHSCPNPAVTLARNGDLVTHIRIQCACGQVIELECVY